MRSPYTKRKERFRLDWDRICPDFRKAFIRFNPRLYILVFTFLTPFFLVEKINFLIENWLLLSEYENSLLVDTTVLCFWVLMVVVLINEVLIRKYVLNNNFVLIVYFNFWLWWLLANYSGRSWVFLKMDAPFNLEYIGTTVVILLIFSTISVCLYELRKYRKDLPNHEGNYFHNDQPKKESENYEKVVLAIVKTIRENSFEKSFSIGLMAPWGSGKSTAVRMIKNVVSREHEDILFVELFPSMNFSNGNITKDFLNEISECISEYDGNLSNSFKAYSKVLYDLVKHRRWYNVSAIFNQNQTSVGDAFDKVNNRLSITGKKLLIVIDDLDRLEETEVIEVFKFIRNTADFKNTFFLLPYDRGNVVENLIHSKNPRFLEKYLQVEFQVLQENQNVLKDHFFEEFERKLRNCGVLPNIDVDNFINELKGAVEVRRVLFTDYVKTYRDCHMVLNQLVALFQTIQQDFVTSVLAADVFHFILFKLYFPREFSSFLESPFAYIKVKNELLEIGDDQNDESEDGFSMLNSVLTGEISTEVLPKKWNGVFYDIKDSTKNDNVLPYFKKKLLETTFWALFKTDTIDRRSIKNPVVFRLFTKLSGDSDDVTYTDFKVLMSSKNKEFLLNLTSNEKREKQVKSYFKSLDTVDEKSVKFLTWAYSILMNDEERPNFLARLASEFFSYLLAFNKDQLNGVLEDIETQFFSKANSFNRCFFISEMIHDDGLLLGGLDRNRILALATVSFKTYLTESTFEDWKTFYPIHFFSRLSLLDGQSFIDVFQDALASGDNSAHCVRSLTLSEKDPLAFKLHNVLVKQRTSLTNTVFQSFNQFRDFLINGLPNTNFKGFNEYLQFLEMLSIWETSIFRTTDFIWNFSEVDMSHQEERVKDQAYSESQKVWNIQAIFELIGDIKLKQENPISNEVSCHSDQFTIGEKSFMLYHIYSRNKVALDKVLDEFPGNLFESIITTNLNRLPNMKLDDDRQKVLNDESDFIITVSVQSNFTSQTT